MSSRLPAFAALLLVGCGTSVYEGDGPDGGRLALRSGFSVLHDSADFTELDPNGVAFSPLDASVAGSVWLVSGTVAGSSIIHEAGRTWRRLFVSRDRGAHWEEHHPDNAGTTDVASDRGFGVIEAGGRATMHVISNGLDPWFADLDLERLTFTTTENVDTFGFDWMRWGSKVGAGVSFGGAGAFAEYDPATGVLTRAVLVDPDPDDPCAPLGAQRYEGFGTFLGECVKASGERCLLGVSLARRETRGDGLTIVEGWVLECVTTDALPDRLAPREHARLDYRGGVWQPVERDDHVWLLGRASESWAVEAPIDLGPGPLLNAAGYGFEPRYPGCVAIGSGAFPERLVGFPEDGGAPIDLGLPRTPCADDAACPDAGLVLMRRVPDGRLFLVYRVVLPDRDLTVVGLVDDPRRAAVTP